MNPELRRNLWLEMSPHRAIAMPAVLLLAFGLVVANNEGEWEKPLFVTAFTLFFLVAVLWGSRQAGLSVTDEVRSRTWDWQRLSSLSPWEMTVGKLWGSTMFAWYGGAFCVATMAFCGLRLPPGAQAGWMIAALAFGAITLQAAALAASLQAARKDSRMGQTVGTWFLIPLVALVAVALARFEPGSAGYVTWYHRPWRLPQFAALSACAFAGWGIIAAHREMARELLVRQWPWAYPTFAMYLAIYVAGFGDFAGAGIRSAFLIGGFVVSLALTYYAIFAEHTTAISLRHLVGHLRGRRYRRAVEALPLWATAFLTAAAFGLAVTVTPHRFEGNEAARWAGLYPAALVMLAARDLGLLVLFALGPRPRRVEGTVLVYILLLSWIVPLFLDGVGLDTAAALFSPWRMGGPAAAGIFAIHAVVAWGAAWRRWRRAERAYAS